MDKLVRQVRQVRQISLALLMSMSFVHCKAVLSNQYGVPGTFGGNNNGGNGFGHFNNGHNNNDQDYVDAEPKSYEFGYAVKDQITGNDFGRQETSDGETVRGEYRVQLPDGRTQIVSYTADWRTGFHADVRYEGTATFPDRFNGQNGGFNNGHGLGFQGNNLGTGFNGGNGGYNNYRGNGNGNHYQYSNSIDNGYNNFGGSSKPSPTYGPAFRH